MGGAIGEWSNEAPKAEPCHWATWVAPLISQGNSLDSQREKPSVGISFWHPLEKGPKDPPKPDPWPPPSPAAKAEVGIEGASPKP